MCAGLAESLRLKVSQEVAIDVSAGIAVSSGAPTGENLLSSSVISWLLAEFPFLSGYWTKDLTSSLIVDMFLTKKSTPYMPFLGEDEKREQESVTKVGEDHSFL